MKAARPSLGLSLQFADPRHRALLPRHRVARWLRAALAGPAQFTVRIVDAEEGQSLNRDYRGKDYATNVLTFAYGEDDAEGGAPADEDAVPGIAADLILCAPVVEREAAEQGKTLEEHYAHLLVHGALHAQGDDHELPDAATAMEQREREVLARLGFADPYR
ncbi:MAG: rRNA maturation RNase YbeY [Methylibium sp.]|uniref:rRNA maturation RNase YbeY n=1 Tax=Methylibium sp. TaxID=2067992 RepID=UPI0017E68580|nr:rRNA maturation RNase YbeY [Methylibium sp.]MBA2722494.1 rRNA maturation RNase YbeY [Methylibium sp.]MBA3588805.1 rRNA maturation RNase YbeY [Methylibium sp.]